MGNREKALNNKDNFGEEPGKEKTQFTNRQTQAWYLTNYQHRKHGDIVWNVKLSYNTVPSHVELLTNVGNLLKRHHYK
jgi:hypothetical protein